MDKPVVALFDFDGTLTRRDTLPLFIRHATGLSGLLLAMLSTLPAMIVLACSGWKSVWGIDAGTTKERLLRRSFQWQSVSHMARIARSFVPCIDAVLAPEVVERMCYHQQQGHIVAIVSASIDVWVEAWADAHQVQHVIATRLAVEHCLYTGKFEGLNCNGTEKVNRIAQLFPREDYHLVAYGNSSGDYPMFQYAHEAYLCGDGTIKPYK